ncbi:MAG: protein-tyrosine-phosphatase [Planctomycetes bacterium]|nr:protein-tyrosine-phosphatase [Planctomycetota bacterium]
MMVSFVDVHCHILPGIDDGPADWDEAIAMARIAFQDGTQTIIATPHQLGSFSQNKGCNIRPLVEEFQQRLATADIPLRVLPGGELRIEPSIITAIVREEALTLGGYHHHVLIELPHDLYLPIDALLADLARRQLVGVLAHPERNGGILRQPCLAVELADVGCLMQITASSLFGSFGPDCQQLAEWMLSERLVHLVASDGHGSRSRRPLLRCAFERIAELTSLEYAFELCCHNPARIAADQPISCESSNLAPCRSSGMGRRSAGWA